MLDREGETMLSSKDRVAELVRVLSATHSMSDADVFQASYVARKLHVSRSMASSYLNTLYSEGVLVKVASRPALFYDRATLEQRHHIKIAQLSFLSTTELLDYVAEAKDASYDFQDLIGSSGSLKNIVEQVKAAACYPPEGLPFLMWGDDEEGKREFRAAVCRWCVSEGITTGQESMVEVDARGLFEAAELPESFRTADGQLVFGDSFDLIWVTNCQALNEEGWRQVLRHFEPSREKGLLRGVSRMFFDCADDPAQTVNASILRCVPIVCRFPSFPERGVDEREAFVYRAFQEESRRISRKVLVSTNAVRRFVGFDGGGIADLRRAIQIACANSMASGAGEDGSIRVSAAHASPVSSTVDGAGRYDEDPAYVDVNQYDPLQRGADVAESLRRFLERLSALPVTQAPSQSEETDVFQSLSGYFELISNRRRGRAHMMLDQPLLQAVSRVFDRCGINEPVGFASHLADSMEFFRENRRAISSFRRCNDELIHTASVAVARLYPFESSVVAYLSNTILDSWGWNMEEENRLVLAFYLHWCIREQKVRCAAVIVAHGYSTASSMADAVNTMLRQHVFDALDMPLDVSSEEIVQELSRYVSKTAVHKDLLIMVDMGSLETIGERVNFALQASVGVIDNVSTALALEAGSLILQQCSVADILTTIKERAKITTSLHMSEQLPRAILFVSENGIAAAARLAELFFSSLPKSVNLEAVPCEYLSVAEQVENGLYQGRRVLFVLGTSNPGIEGVNFVLLENVVDLTEDDSLNIDLSEYLAPDEIKMLRSNLIKNFTLENLMKHLTILEPDHLMNVVSGSIEQLQRNLGMTFSPRMLMRLYVHVSYLVERLVTRRYVSDESMSDFERSEAEFVRSVRASFRGITAAYGVDLPISEIHYVFTLINFVEPKGGGAEEEDFFAL